MSLSATTAVQASVRQAELNASSADQQPTTREAFQSFVAGTFYQQMLKAMRSTQSEVQYLGGSQAEKVFQNQLDQIMAESLAKQHGAAFSDPLYPSFQSHRNADAPQTSQFDELA